MRNSSHPTLGEVARKAGVGTTTVSRVINGGDRVSPQTMERVLQVIKTLGYTPNHAARTLKGHPTKTIGLVIPSIVDPFFAVCAEAAQVVARANDSLLIVTTTQNDLAMEMESLDVLIQHRTDGLLIAPSASDSRTLRELLDRVALPVVCIDRPIYESSLPAVVADNFAGARAATQHLIDHGYKRIACLTGDSLLYTIGERIRGYYETVTAAGLKSIIDIGITDYRSAERAIKKLLVGSQPPDAIFALKNSVTMYAFEVLQEFNVAVPDSVALLGFDDFELASTVRPSISVVRQPVEKMASAASALIFKQLSDRGRLTPYSRRKNATLIKLPTDLVLRGSCGCRPIPG